MYRSSLDNFHVIIAWCEDIYDRSGGSRPSDKGGRGGGGHPDPEISGGGWGRLLKIRGEAGPSPGFDTGSLPLSSAEASLCCVTRFLFFDYCYFLL